MRGEAHPPLLLTMGEPAGVGGEIALKAWLAREDGAVPPFAVIDGASRLRELARHLDWPVPVEPVASAAAAIDVFSRALPVLDRPLARPVRFGHPDPGNAAAVLSAIEVAVNAVRDGEAAAIVTNPIHKKTLYDAGFAFPGHTEYLASLAGGTARPVMMLACPQLKVIPVTVHLPLKRAVETLASVDIVAVGAIAAAALSRDFGICRPRLAVAGLNPHAGEEGALGDEEQAVIAPAVAGLRAVGIDASGPHPPDTLFSPRARSGYDAALCMYHDQALIPLKALDFDGGVNVTLGLPFVRTSPDHGTAFDLAGSGRASAASVIAALQVADQIARRRVGDPA